MWTLIYFGIIYSFIYFYVFLICSNSNLLNIWITLQGSCFWFEGRGFEPQPKLWCVEHAVKISPEKCRQLPLFYRWFKYRGHILLGVNLQWQIWLLLFGFSPTMLSNTHCGRLRFKCWWNLKKKVKWFVGICSSSSHQQLPSRSLLLYSKWRITFGCSRLRGSPQQIIHICDLAPLLQQMPSFTQTLIFLSGLVAAGEYDLKTWG